MLDAQRAGRLALEDGDGRYGWLPLQFALLPEEYDGQAELNRLLARLAGRPFVGGNRLAYVAGSQFRATLRRQLASARHYHVLWIHDFPGVIDGGRPDSVAFNATLAYLQALTAAARAYDARARFPQYYIFLDQHYYDARGSRMWMNILERPLRERIELPAGSEGMVAALTAQQDSLRAAVGASAKLQEAARARGGRWLERVVKVHVNITHPADPSFVSSHMVLGLPFVPDNIARDHRKLAFMDLSVDDPNAGSAILAGVGVGENYADPTWDDRALAISGPAALALLEEVKRLLQRNGFSDDELPAALRIDDGTLARRQPVDALTTGVLIASNDVGFGVKAASAVQMGLLTLMPAGSLMYIPDSIWTSMIYASELVVAALRGCHVRIVAPSLANAPSAAAPTMARTWDLFTRLLEIELGLKATLASRHGDFRVGFYQRHARLDDPAGLLREVADGLERESWLQGELGLTGASPALRRLADSLGQRPQGFGRAIQDTLRRAPRLHAKTQLFLSGPAWRGLLAEERLRPLLRAEVLPTLGLQLPMDDVGMPVGSDELMALAARTAERLPVDGEGAASMFLTVGSQNKDLRSMLLDGEMKAVVAGPKALIGLLEFVYIMGLSRFPDSQEELEQLMPAWSEKTRSLAYKIRRAL
jgi:phosphatidylserine/phosphatidylglycerophosphate/cardiolipin synthase-like enzyme